MPSTLIAQMVIGAEFVKFYVNRPNGDWHRVFFIAFFAPSVNHPNGDCWRGLFSPPKPIAQMAVGGEGPFLFVLCVVYICCFQFLPLSQSLNGDWWRGLFSPSKPIAQMAVGGEEPFCFFEYLPL